MAASIDEQLRELVAFAYENGPAMREHFDKAGVKPEDIQTRADLEKLPIFSKDSVVARQQADPPFGGMLAVPMSEVKRLFFSPGPVYEPQVGEDTALRRTTIMALERCGFTSDDVVLNSLSYHLVPAGLLVDFAVVELGCIVIPGGTGPSDLQLKMAIDFGATAYVGTPSFLVSLIDKAESMGLNFKEVCKIRKAMVTAEPITAPVRERLEANDIVVGNAYATAELGFMAVNMGGGFPMQLLSEPIVEVVNLETGQCVGPGEAGEIVVTRLHKAYPLIRYGTGDMAINVDPNPGESKQEERSIILVGRSGEAVKVRGMFVHPNQLRAAVGQVTQMSGVQGVVSRPDVRDQFHVRVALAEGVEATEELAEMIKGAVRQLCRVRVDDVAFVDAIDADQRTMLDEREWA